MLQDSATIQSSPPPAAVTPARCLTWPTFLDPLLLSPGCPGQIDPQTISGL